jgi:hypothetical protein
MMKLLFIEPHALVAGSTDWRKHLGLQGLQSEPQKYVSPAPLQVGSEVQPTAPPAAGCAHAGFVTGAHGVP